MARLLSIKPPMTIKGRKSKGFRGWAGKPIHPPLTLVTYGAACGGSLVFDYRFNVEGLKGSTAWNETEEDQLPGKKG